MHMLTFPLLIGGCVVFRWLRDCARQRLQEHRKKERHSPPPLLTKLETSDVEFSASALAQGSWWVLVSATFDHADYRHLVNNMLHLVCVAPALEARVGASWL